MLLLIAMLAAALHLLAGGLLFLRLIHGTARVTGRGLPLGLAAVAALLHAVVVWSAVWTPVGLNLGFFNALAVVSLFMVVGMLLATSRLPVCHLGVILLPISAFSVLMACTPDCGTVVPREPGVDLHILTSMLGYSTLALAAIQALILAALDYRLRHRRMGGFVRRLPALNTMEQQLFGMLWLGFALLSVGLLTGLVFVDDLLAQHLVHKTTLSVVAWVVFGTLLVGRWRLGWRGQTAVRWTLGGFAALMLAYFGSKFVLELLLA
ncbi:cytochrome C assembly family protein [Alkalilimnicola ehrlichii MLHE-1]|nr:cytochrome c biogenesis protein CcsA [Alkalilimnicola ehrlichii]